MLGVAGAFAATVLTWFVMTAVIGSLPASEDVLLAITGITAVIVLLLVMNWFFHKVYWTDHIKELNSKKRELVDASEGGGDIKYWGFVALGFTAVYREGFEVVLFLQNLNIVAGGAAVFWGVVLGLAGTTVVGFLTFFLHHKLPYKRMLVLTGVLLGLVLVIMVGGSARTLQSLGWISTTPLPFGLPEWWARWFEIVPTVETVLIQLLAAVFVVGSYYAAEWWSKEKRRRARVETGAVRVVSAAPIPLPHQPPASPHQPSASPRRSSSRRLPPSSSRLPPSRRPRSPPAPSRHLARGAPSQPPRRLARRSRRTACSRRLPRCPSSRGAPRPSPARQPPCARSSARSAGSRPSPRCADIPPRPSAGATRPSPSRRPRSPRQGRSTFRRPRRQRPRSRRDPSTSSSIPPRRWSAAARPTWAHGSGSATADPSRTPCRVPVEHGAS